MSSQKFRTSALPILSSHLGILSMAAAIHCLPVDLTGLAANFQPGVCTH